MTKGYTLRFSNDVFEITNNNNEVILTVLMRNNSLIVDLESKNQSALRVSNDDGSKLGHKRFGHFNYSSLKHIFTYQVMKNLPLIEKSKTMC